MNPFHPESIATTRAHNRRPPGTCASDEKRHPGRCDCRPDPDDLAEVWAGRARMAGGRRAAGAPLDATDVEALRRIGEAAGVTHVSVPLAHPHAQETPTP